MITAIWRRFVTQATDMSRQLWRAQFVRSSWEHAPPAQWWREDKIGNIDHDIGTVMLRDLGIL